jgi:hypothetical protein
MAGSLGRRELDGRATATPATSSCPTHSCAIGNGGKGKRTKSAISDLTTINLTTWPTKGGLCGGGKAVSLEYS